MLADNRFDALGDATRRSILEALRSGPHTVGELADLLPVSRPAVSQHVKVLREADLVHVSSAGTRRVVSLNADGLESTRDAIEGLWRSALDTFVSEAQTGRDRSGGS